MISISMIVADTDGNIVISDTTNCDFGKRPARVSRTACLDGTVHIGHYGVVDGDRTFYLDCQVTEAQEVTLNYIHTNSTTVLLGCKEGLFLGSFSDFDAQNGRFKATFLVKSKENE